MFRIALNLTSSKMLLIITLSLSVKKLIAFKRNRVVKSGRMKRKRDTGWSKNQYMSEIRIKNDDRFSR